MPAIKYRCSFIVCKCNKDIVWISIHNEYNAIMVYILVRYSIFSTKWGKLCAQRRRKALGTSMDYYAGIRRANNGTNKGNNSERAVMKLIISLIMVLLSIKVIIITAFGSFKLVLGFGNKSRNEKLLIQRGKNTVANNKMIKTNEMQQEFLHGVYKNISESLQEILETKAQTIEDATSFVMYTDVNAIVTTKMKYTEEKRNAIAELHMVNSKNKQFISINTKGEVITIMLTNLNKYYVCLIYMRQANNYAEEWAFANHILQKTNNDALRKIQLKEHDDKQNFFKRWGNTFERLENIPMKDPMKNLGKNLIGLANPGVLRWFVRIYGVHSQLGEVTDYSLVQAVLQTLSLQDVDYKQKGALDAKLNMIVKKYKRVYMKYEMILMSVSYGELSLTLIDNNNKLPFIAGKHDITFTIRETEESIANKCQSIKKHNTLIFGSQVISLIVGPIQGTSEFMLKNNILTIREFKQLKELEGKSWGNYEQHE